MNSQNISDKMGDTFPLYYSSKKGEMHMKVRLDFVTNSSSSSYVVAFKQLSEDETNKLPMFAKKLVEGFVNMLSAIKSKEDLDKYFLEYYGYETIDEMLAEDEWAKRRYDEWLDKINQGFAIGEISVEYGDETMPGFLRSISDGESVIILSDD
jgi:hypothetical protein